MGRRRRVGSLSDGGQNGEGSEEVDDTGESSRLDNSEGKRIQIEPDRMPGVGGPGELTEGVLARRAQDSI